MRAGRGRNQRVGTAESGHGRAGAGADAASVGGCRVVEAAGRGLAGFAGRLVTVERPPQGIADGADGHAERIKADRGRPGRGPWSIDAHPSTRRPGRLETC